MLHHVTPVFQFFSHLFMKRATSETQCEYVEGVTHDFTFVTAVVKGLNEAQKSVYSRNGLFVYQKDTKNGCPPPFFRS